MDEIKTNLTDNIWETIAKECNLELEEEFEFEVAEGFWKTFYFTENGMRCVTNSGNPYNHLEQILNNRDKIYKFF